MNSQISLNRFDAGQTRKSSDSRKSFNERRLADAFRADNENVFVLRVQPLKLRRFLSPPAKGSQEPARFA